MTNAIIIDAKDNVAVAIEPIKKGDTISYMLDDCLKSLTALEDIAIYHKVAISDIADGEPVVKYGEHIGLATTAVRSGEHIHVHNVKECREWNEAKE